MALRPVSNNAQTTAYQAIAKVSGATIQAVTQMFGPEYVITPQVVIGRPNDGDSVLIIFDELQRPWMIASVAGASAAPFSQTFGDGSSRTFVITHNMGTQSITASVRQTASPFSEIEAEVEFTSADTITIRTSPGEPAPAVGQYTVVLVGGVVAGPSGPPGGASYSQAIGDGSARAFVIPHNLGSLNVQVSVYTNALPRTEVTAEVERTDSNTVTVRTRAVDPAPTAGQYTVVVSAPGAAQYSAIAPVPKVTTLPASPVDGQEVHFQDATMAAQGAVWHLRYNISSASAYKWEFVGGGAMRNEIITGEASATAGWVDLATVGPTITAPLAGDYEIQAGADSAWAASANAFHQIAVQRGAVTPVQNDVVVNYSDTTGAVFGGVRQAMGNRLFTGLAASTILRMKYNNAGGINSATPTWSYRWLSVKPVRVG